jgi:hypothetical protein
LRFTIQNAIQDVAPGEWLAQGGGVKASLVNCLIDPISST